MADPESLARVVVCDAGPLIHLDELGAIDLLRDFQEVLVPSVVWLEVSRHRPAALENRDIPLRRVVASGRLPHDLATVARLFALHPGEVRALQIARRPNTDLLLTDDTSARLAARMFNIPVHGTIGILIRSIRRGQKTANEVIEVLRSLPTASSLHIRRSLLDEIVRGIEESTYSDSST